MTAELLHPVLLYVEDDMIIQASITEVLQEAGYDLLIADDGTQAKQLLAENGDVIRGLITDINLGDGPDGWEVARAVREARAGLPVVYVTAASEHEWTSQGVPGSLIIQKPFAPAQIIVAISSLLVEPNTP